MNKLYLWQLWGCTSYEGIVSNAAHVTVGYSYCLIVYKLLLTFLMKKRQDLKPEKKTKVWYKNKRRKHNRPKKHFAIFRTIPIKPLKSNRWVYEYLLIRSEDLRSVLTHLIEPRGWACWHDLYLGGSGGWIWIGFLFLDQKPVANPSRVLPVSVPVLNRKLAIRM